MKTLIVLVDGRPDCYVATQERKLHQVLANYAEGHVWRMARIEGGHWAWFDGSPKSWEHIVAVPFPLKATVLV